MVAARTVETAALPALIALCVLVTPAVSLVTAVPGNGDEGESDVVAPSPGIARTAGAPSVTYVDSCTAITEPGRYVLTADFGAAAGLSQSCLRVRASGVVVEGDGHTLQGRGVSDTTGIVVNGTAGAANVTVRDVTVMGFNRGIAAVNSSDIVVRNVTASRNAYGVDIKNTIGARIVANNLSQNVVGIRLTNTTDTRVVGNNLSQNGATGMVVEHRQEETTASKDVGSAPDGDRGLDQEGARDERGQDEGTARDESWDGRWLFNAGLVLTILAIFTVVWRYQRVEI